MKNNIYTFMVIIAGIFWGSIGIFTKLLAKYGFTSIQISAIRLISGALVMALFNPKMLKIKIKDIWLFVILGIFCLFSMVYLYSEAIKLTSLSLAATLLYTAPIMVTVMSAIFFNEKLNFKKICALIFAFLGTIFVSGFDKTGTITIKGIACGLMSGLSYALYSIVGKVILKKYNPFTMVANAFIIASAAALIICKPIEIINIAVNSANKLPLYLEMIGFGIFTIATPFLLYTFGLKHIPAGKASILASIEPLTATAFGIILFNERLSFISAIGMILILTAVISLGLGVSRSK